MRSIADRGLEQTSGLQAHQGLSEVWCPEKNKRRRSFFRGKVPPWAQEKVIML